MERRHFLATTTMVAAAGCLGYEIEPESNIEDRKTQIEELESNLESVESELSEVESELETAEGELESAKETVEDQAEEIESLEGEVDTKRREHVASLYEVAEVTRQYGNGAWSSAVENWDSEEYKKAYSYYGRAYANYAESKRILGRCADKAREYNIDIVSVIEESENYSEAMREASFYYMNAALSASNGKANDASSFQDKADTHFETSKRHDTLDSDEFRKRLGLDSSNQA